jgi:hypothetical protein
MVKLIMLFQRKASPVPENTWKKLFMRPGMTFRYKLFTIEENKYSSNYLDLEEKIDVP